MVSFGDTFQDWHVLIFLLVLNCMQIVFCKTIKVLICDVVRLFTIDRFPIGQNGHECAFHDEVPEWRVHC